MNSASSERGDARMPNTVPYSSIDLPEVMTRNSAARDVLGCFATAAPTLAPAWEVIRAALTDARALAAEVAQLSAELAAAQLDRANALAAIRATLAADRDAEQDPLWYLRDELQAVENAAKGRAEGSHG
jgi:hypothetical protein